MKMKKMVTALLNASSKNKYLKIQANRLHGDEAYATGDYRDAITFYLKWKEDTIEARGQLLVGQPNAGCLVWSFLRGWLTLPSKLSSVILF